MERNSKPVTDVFAVFCNGEVHSRKCEHRTRARGMVRSIIRIVTIHSRKNSL